MSASSNPTVRPLAAKPSARLTPVAALPTPPLPDATATIERTPGTSARWSPRPRAPGDVPGDVPGPPGAGAAGAPAAGFSAVITAVTDSTPGSVSTACSAAL